MAKYNLSKIMKRAWEIKKENTDNIFGECLKMAWVETKAPAVKSKKELIIGKLGKMAEAAEERYVFKYAVYVSDWAKYGKDRTYLAVFETSNGTTHNVKIECGYFDNVLNKYVPGRVDIEDRYDLCGREL